MNIISSRSKFLFNVTTDIPAQLNQLSDSGLKI